MKKTILSCSIAISIVFPAINYAGGLDNIEMQGMQSSIIYDTFEETIEELEKIRLNAESRSKKYTLDEALRFTLQNNPAINAAYKSVQSKQWSAISDKRLWWPTIMGAGPFGDMTTIPTHPTLGQRFTSRKGKHGVVV